MKIVISSLIVLVCFDVFALTSYDVNSRMTRLSEIVEEITGEASVPGFTIHGDNVTDVLTEVLDDLDIYMDILEEHIKKEEE